MIIYKLSEKDWWPKGGGGVWLKCTERLTCVIFVTIFVPTYCNKSSVFHSWGGRQVHVSAPGMDPSGKKLEGIGSKTFFRVCNRFSETLYVC